MKLRPKLKYEHILCKITELIKFSKQIIQTREITGKLYVNRQWLQTMLMHTQYWDWAEKGS